MFHIYITACSYPTPQHKITCKRSWAMSLISWFLLLSSSAWRYRAKKKIQQHCRSFNHLLPLLHISPLVIILICSFLKNIFGTGNEKRLKKNNNNYYNNHNKTTNFISVHVQWKKWMGTAMIDFYRGKMMKYYSAIPTATYFNILCICLVMKIKSVFFCFSGQYTGKINDKDFLDGYSTPPDLQTYFPVFGKPQYLYEYWGEKQTN